MKPDKIYVPSFKPIINGVFAAREIKQGKNDTEYIRKDALLRFLEKNMKSRENDKSLISTGYYNAFWLVKEFINSLSSL